MAYSFRSIVDGGADSDMVYYNASIINTNSSDAGTFGPPPAVKFNETRDAPIVKDASQYNFSIIRFSMNGPNKNLPLFIPIIQTNGTEFPNQQDVNRTIYYVTIAYQRQWAYTDVSGAAATKIFTIAPQSTPVIYRPETQNTVVAPVPQVPVTGIARQDLSSRYYWVYTYKHMMTLINEAMMSAMNLAYNAFQAAWNADTDISGASPFPYADFAAFLADHDAPFIKYNEESTLMEIYGDTRAFNVSGQLGGDPDTVTGAPAGTNVPVPAFVAAAIPAPPFAAQPVSTPYLRLFFNSNLFGLCTNFKNTFYGANQGSKLVFPLPSTTPTVVTLPTTAFLPTIVPCAYTNEILFQNDNYTNILNNNPFLQGLQSVPPPAYNPYFLIPTIKQRLYWISKQDYNSTNSLWSPISAIVFTSTLLPVKKEYASQPVSVGQSNAGVSTGSASQFEAIISDITIDQQVENADGWRDFTLYEPTAEYKMMTLTASHDEIRNIDIQVFWRYRLTGDLYPLTMFNCSDVNIKMLFRKADL